MKEETKMPHNGKLLTDYVQKTGFSKTKLAQKLGKTYPTVAKYSCSDSLQMRILWEASNALNYNLIAEIGELLPVAYQTKREKELEDEIASLHKEMEQLKIELSVYQKIVGK